MSISDRTQFNYVLVVDVVLQNFTTSNDYVNTL